MVQSIISLLSLHSAHSTRSFSEKSDRIKRVTTHNVSLDRLELNHNHTWILKTTLDIKTNIEANQYIDYSD